MSLVLGSRRLYQILIDGSTRLCSSFTSSPGTEVKPKDLVIKCLEKVNVNMKKKRTDLWPDVRLM